MREIATTTIVIVLSGLASTAHGQFGGGFSPPKSDPTPPAVAPPAAPTPPPAQVPAVVDDEEDPDAPPARPRTPAAPPETKDQPAERVTCTAPESAWIAKLESADRDAIEGGLGYALPAMGADVKWVGATVKDGAPTFTGKVVIIQSFDVASGGTAVLDKLVTALGTLATDGSVIVVGVQVPSKVEAATKRLEKSKCKANICVDERGAFCDAIGAFKKPINLIVDRNGAIRYAGLSEKGAALASKVLLSEPVVAVNVEQKPKAPVVVTDGGQFPSFTEPLTHCTDLRGQKSPDLSVERWITKQPNMLGKLVIIDFFATWCSPCMAVRPHMNEIARAYAKDIVIVGLSSETNNKFTDGLKRLKLKENDFSYSIALDPASRMQTGFGVRGIPCIAIVSSDQIVRWQGSPQGLTPAVLDPLIAANAKLADAGRSGNNGRGWSK
ncbi:MAG: TlpA family protein disulfide reductase [Phycisphaerales bacterium]|nr:TlpA family protein disulfide reductase [Phycisphaerales bacterium]